jgi:hypothetical protein
MVLAVDADLIMMFGFGKTRKRKGKRTIKVNS